jgi:hypothetical protein
MDQSPTRPAGIKADPHSVIRDVESSVEIAAVRKQNGAVRRLPAHFGVAARLNRASDPFGQQCGGVRGWIRM